MTLIFRLNFMSVRLPFALPETPSLVAKLLSKQGQPVTCLPATFPQIASSSLPCCPRIQGLRCGFVHRMDGSFHPKTIQAKASEVLLAGHGIARFPLGRCVLPVMCFKGTHGTVALVTVNSQDSRCYNSLCPYLLL